MAVKFSLTIFLLFFLTCQKSDDEIYDTPIDETGLIGEWLLKETYISPGGATEWKDVDEGFRYFFKSDGSYQKTDFTKDLQEKGEFEVKQNQLFLYFVSENEKDTLGYSSNFNDERRILTLSPIYPSMCIEGCLYRFRKQ